MAEIRPTNLDFHQTFKPERSCLTSIFQSVPFCEGKTVQEISVHTGVPTGRSSGKVLPTIQYLEYMGLINVQKKDGLLDLKYTLLGQIILSEDLGFMEELTLLLLHCFLLRPRSGATLWNCIFCRILPGHHGSVGIPELETELRMIFGKCPLLAPFLGTYTGLFDKLNLLKVDERGYQMGVHLYRREFIYLYTIVLYEYWDEWLSGFSAEERMKMAVSDSEISSIQIEQTGFRLPFGWSESDEYKVLEEMNSFGLVSLNRQMTPFTLRKIKTRDELTALLYSELC